MAVVGASCRLHKQPHSCSICCFGQHLLPQKRFKIAPVGELDVWRKSSVCLPTGEGPSERAHALALQVNTSSAAPQVIQQWAIDFPRRYLPRRRRSRRPSRRSLSGGLPPGGSRQSGGEPASSAPLRAAWRRASAFHAAPAPDASLKYRLGPVGHGGVDLEAESKRNPTSFSPYNPRRVLI